ncbi:MAG: hypothetical protein ACOYBP_09205 [Microbacteriaceae bacterium]
MAPADVGDGAALHRSGPSCPSHPGDPGLRWGACGQHTTLPPAQAAAMVSCSPKSNRVGKAYFAAMEDVKRLGSQPVPPHLLPASHPRMRSHGIGVGYEYPHDHEGGDVDQQYLPDKLVGRRYYVPSDQGYEARIRDRMDALMEQRRKSREGRRRGP